MQDETSTTKPRAAARPFPSLVVARELRFWGEGSPAPVTDTQKRPPGENPNLAPFAPHCPVPPHADPLELTVLYTNAWIRL